MQNASSQYTRYVLFVLGAAVGSALGLVIGSLLTFWVGEGAVKALQRGIKRINGNDDHPNFDLLLQ